MSAPTITKTRYQLTYTVIDHLGRRHGDAKSCDDWAEARIAAQALADQFKVDVDVTETSVTVFRPVEVVAA